MSNSVKCRHDDLYPSEISHHELVKLQCGVEASRLTDALDRQIDVMARDIDRQVTELQVRVAILNRFTHLGTPPTQRVF